MIKKIPRKISILLAIELLILLIVIISIVIRHSHTDAISLDTADLTYNNLTLNPGSYSLIIDYTTKDDVYFSISSPGTNAVIRGAYGFLRYQYNTVTLRFRTHETLHSLSIEPAAADGFNISSITLTGNCDSRKRGLVIMITAFLLSDQLIWLLLYRNKDKRKENLIVAITLTAVTVTASLPLFIPGIVMGHDIAIHLQRIESIYQDLLRGAFPVRIDSSALRNYGYPISVYYGDILLYPAALLRMAGFDITESWKIYFFTMNAATAVITYLCSAKIFRSRGIALVLACAYTTVPYRLGNLYARSAVGEFSAMTFYPVIAYAVYRIYTDEPDRIRSRRYSSILAVSMAFIICTHILSSEMVIFTLAVTALILFKKTFSRNILLTLISAAVKTVLLSAFFTVPFIDCYLSTPTIISEMVSNELPAIQAEGLRISDFFSLPLTQNSCYSSPGIIFTLTLIAGIPVLIINRKRKNPKKPALGMLVLISLLMALMSTGYFPWDLLAATGVGKIMAQIQFPWRFISILAILLTLLLGCLLKYADIRPAFSKFKKYISCFIYAASVITCILITLVCTREMTSMTPVNSCDLDSEAIGSGEYVLSGSNVWFREINDRLIDDANKNRVSGYTLNGTGLTLNCLTGDSDTGILIPKYNYKGYRIYDRTGNKIPVINGANNLVSFILPAGYEGPVYVRFTEPLYWRIAELITLITLIAVLFSKPVYIFPSAYRHMS